MVSKVKLGLKQQLGLTTQPKLGSKLVQNRSKLIPKPIKLVNKYAEMGPNNKIGQVNDKFRVPET